MSINWNVCFNTILRRHPWEILLPKRILANCWIRQQRCMSQKKFWYGATLNFCMELFFCHFTQNVKFPHESFVMLSAPQVYKRWNVKRNVFMQIYQISDKNNGYQICSSYSFLQNLFLLFLFWTGVLEVRLFES